MLCYIENYILHIHTNFVQKTENHPQIKIMFVISTFPDSCLQLIFISYADKIFGAHDKTKIIEYLVAEVDMSK